jgi:hypothetical protein
MKIIRKMHLISDRSVWESLISWGGVTPEEYVCFADCRNKKYWLTDAEFTIQFDSNKAESRILQISHNGIVYGPIDMVENLKDNEHVT